MGLMSYFSDKARLHNEYKKAVKSIDDGFDSKSGFMVDTNHIVVLAIFEDMGRLKSLIESKKFRFTEAVIGELWGLSHGRIAKLSDSVRSLLREFLEMAIKLKPIDRVYVSNAIKKRSSELVSLIPRKLVSDVMVGLKDSFANRVAEAYKKVIKNIIKIHSKKIDLNQKRLLKERYLRMARRAYDKEVSGLRRKIERRYLDLCDKLRVDDYKINEKEYFRMVDTFKRRILSESDALVENTMGDPDKFLERLKVWTRKKYDGDVRFVAEVLALGVKGYSLDSDVITLLELCAARTL